MRRTHARARNAVESDRVVANAGFADDRPAAGGDRAAAAHVTGNSGGAADESWRDETARDASADATALSAGGTDDPLI